MRRQIKTFPSFLQHSHYVSYVTHTKCFCRATTPTRLPYIHFNPLSVSHGGVLSNWETDGSRTGPGLDLASVRQ